MNDIYFRISQWIESFGLVEVEVASSVLNEKLATTVTQQFVQSDLNFECFTECITYVSFRYYFILFILCFFGH